MVSASVYILRRLLYLLRFGPKGGRLLHFRNWFWFSFSCWIWGTAQMMVSHSLCFYIRPRKRRGWGMGKYGFKLQLCLALNTQLPSRNESSPGNSWIVLNAGGVPLFLLSFPTPWLLEQRTLAPSGDDPPSAELDTRCLVAQRSLQALQGDIGRQTMLAPRPKLSTKILHNIVICLLSVGLFKF